jgi:hypothetical protein
MLVQVQPEAEINVVSNIKSFLPVEADISVTKV